MGFPRQEYGVGCHFLLQGIFPDPGIKPGSPTLQGDSLPSEPPGSTEKSKRKRYALGGLKGRVKGWETWMSMDKALLNLQLGDQEEQEVTIRSFYVAF